MGWISIVAASPVALAIALGGCASHDRGPIEDEAGGWASFERINRQPFPTALHQGHPLVNVWTNPLATGPYRALSAGTPPVAGFPVGAMVVKEMMDAAGGPPILTVMAKQAAGYDPAHGDWWYGRLDAEGNPTDGAFVGRVGFCIACHDGASATDHLFGVAADNL